MFITFQNIRTLHKECTHTLHSRCVNTGQLGRYVGRRKGVYLMRATIRLKHIEYANIWCVYIRIVSLSTNKRYLSSGSEI
jgi:hypothetical protein